MSVCSLKPLSNGLGYCPVCDPFARRPIPLTVRRQCGGRPIFNVHAIQEGRPGPGTVLSGLLARFGIVPTDKCGCKDLARQMDRNGPDWVWANARKIVDHMLQEAAKRPILKRIPGKRLIAYLLVWYAAWRGPIPTARQVGQLPCCGNGGQPESLTVDFKDGVVNVVHCVWQKNWQDMGRRSQNALGPGFKTHQIVKPPLDILRQMAEQAPGPTVFVNHSFIVPVTDWLDVVASFPQHRFLVINHCSLNHMTRWPKYFADEKLLLASLSKYRNLFYACPDQQTAWGELGYDRYFHWPNPVYVPDGINARWKEISPPMIVIVGRDDWSKAFATQIFAMGLMAKARPDLRFGACIRPDTKNNWFYDLADSCRITLEKLEWKEHDGWYDMLTTKISLVLQASLAESFNYVSVDAALCGRPFVGSGSIRHTPPEWKAEPWQPSDIARVALQILDDYDENCRKALEIGRAVRAENNRKYRQLFDRILA